MKKTIRFCFTNPKATQIDCSITDKWGFTIKMVGSSSYTLQELQLISEQLLNENFEIEINLPSNKTNKKEYIKCGECKHFNENYGCQNDSARIKNRNFRTRLSKGCFWGEKICN